MKRRIVLIALVFSLFGTLSAQGGLGLGPVLGYQKAQDAEEGSILGGVALRMKVNSLIGVEGSILYRSEEYEDSYVKVVNYPVMATGLIYPIPNIYGAIGAGWYNTRIKYDYDKTLSMIEPDDETTQEFGWHFGAGAELPVGRTTKLTADIRYVFIDYDFKNAPYSDEVENDFFIINIGLLFGL